MNAISFNAIVDQVISSFNERFIQLEAHNNKFSILWKFAKIPRPELTKQCKQLEIALTDGGDCDIDGAMLADELDSFKSLNPSRMAGKILANCCSTCTITSFVMLFHTLPLLFETG